MKRPLCYNGFMNAKLLPSPEYPFESKFAVVEGYDIHYVEEGQGEPVLFVHGNPTSSYLWRNIFPAVAKNTCKRCIAVDLLGFGGSDNPDVEYTAELHFKILEGFIEKLELKNIVLVLHDWGGPIGMRYATAHPQNIKGLALMETFFWELNWKKDFPGSATFLFKLFRSPIGFFMAQLVNTYVEIFIPTNIAHREHVNEKMMEFYRAPFQAVRSRKVIKKFTEIIPIEGKPRKSAIFMKEISKRLPLLKFPILWIFADQGLFKKEDAIKVRATLPQIDIRHVGPAKHFLQEDQPEAIAALLSGWIKEKGI